MGADIYSAEKLIVRALPRMAKAAESQELKQAFTKHLNETKGHAQLLGYSEAEKLLQQTLSEEEAADRKLTQIGEGGINRAAAAAGGEPEPK